MSEDSAGHTTRWRNATALFASENVPESSHISRPSAPQLSAPTAVNPASQSAILDQYSSNAWVGKSYTHREPMAKESLPRLTEPRIATTTQSTTYYPDTYERHGPAPSGDSYHDQLANTSPRETFTGPWRNLHLNDRRTGSGNNTDTPLTLHIPQLKDLPRTSSTSTVNSVQSRPQHFSTATPSTSLPSFASLKEPSTRSEDVDGPEIAPMSSRLSCSVCAKLHPLVREVVEAVAELDEVVRFRSNKPANPPLEVAHHENAVGTVQWILNQLRSAKSHLQETNQRNLSGYPHQFPGSVPGEQVSPPITLKRTGETWERDDYPPKRPRSGVSHEQAFYLPPFTLTPRDDHRSSIDFALREPRLGYSPPPTESVPGSAYPRNTSPIFTRHDSRALPSPASLVYPPSAASSLPPLTAPSVGSPATSYQPASSIHTTPANSVTSAQIAELQHQVTLKSLSLQTLQTEYASLLQKLQRERVKSQTIEKKTSVADQEVNDLTGRNEDLSEQIRSLTAQLEECEKKREAERLEAQREKEQWGRMLEMSGRLHAKVDTDRQRLLIERDTLVKRLRVHEGDFSTSFDQHSGTSEPDSQSRALTSRPDQADRTPQSNHSPASGISSARGTGAADVDETAALRREIVQLQTRVKSLRLVLAQSKQHISDMEEKSRIFLEQCNSSVNDIDLALKDDSGPPSSVHQSPSDQSTPTRTKPNWLPPPSSTVSTATPPDQSKGKLDVVVGGKVTSADMAGVGRARSPGPHELGFEVIPSRTSPPEESMRTLGPVPNMTPMSSVPFAPAVYSWDDERSKHSSSAPERTRNHIPDLSMAYRQHGVQLSGGNPPQKSSPQSNRSSPGGILQDGSSGSGSAGGYTSEPEAPVRSHAQPLPSISALPQFRLQSTVMPADMPRFRESGQLTISTMPPPPKPDTTAARDRL